MFVKTKKNEYKFNLLKYAAEIKSLSIFVL